ncbi:uncharacterized protein K489DRAFT_378297 [Dissoconium aciculare CBS 342.82]|uniref:Uncharacterized protein n=1 Tax=Dissoconium aciculare CBS 342.82 TaxID=1314786 RepID=A0A6J3M7Q0_9PEZI|nr:uncharacterized protein K489DRAFT_378297 [Dissoconium aciculare CBS 342.82]KAF1823923.1 hypothetical protein K489DRAFT_378297 [Dissoconium aciculare CBS 342.82]
MSEATTRHSKARRNRSEAGVYQEHRKSKSESRKRLSSERRSSSKQRESGEEGCSRKANHQLHEYVHQGIAGNISFGLDGDEEMPGSNVAE